MDISLLHTITEPTKFQIIKLLMQHNYCVRALSKKLDISEPAVSQQLNILKKTGIISGKKIGYQMHYQVNVGLIEETVNILLSCFKERAALPVVDADCSCEFASSCIRYNNDRGNR
jgi:ArsR family transcriptional regulator